MKVEVKIRLKPAILDPQGKAVHSAMSQLGFEGVNGARVGKLIELDVDDSIANADVRKMVEDAGQKLLSNPVIEDFEISLIGD